MRVCFTLCNNHAYQRVDSNSAADRLHGPFKGRQPLGLLLNACFGELLCGDDELPVCKALSSGAHEIVRR